jgi:hypothetical protein
MRLAQFTEHSSARQEISATRPRSYVVRDANDQSLAYVYGRATENEALQAKALTEDEARRIAINIAAAVTCWPPVAHWRGDARQRTPYQSFKARTRSVVCEHRATGSRFGKRQDDQLMVG